MECKRKSAEPSNATPTATAELPGIAEAPAHEESQSLLEVWPMLCVYMQLLRPYPWHRL